MCRSPLNEIIGIVPEQTNPRARTRSSNIFTGKSHTRTQTQQKDYSVPDISFGATEYLNGGETVESNENRTIKDRLTNSHPGRVRKVLNIERHDCL